MALREDYSIQECADWCDSTPGCLAFEYGVNHGGNQTLYASRDCQLQSHADPAPASVCADYNLDLYVQPAFECPEGTLGPYNNRCYCLDYTDSRYKPVDSFFCDGSDSATTDSPIWTTSEVTQEPISPLDECRSVCEMNTCEEDGHNTMSSDQMLSCMNACYMRHIGVSNSECLGHCDRHGLSGCQLSVNQVDFVLCYPRDIRGSQCMDAPRVSVSDCELGCESYPEEDDGWVIYDSQYIAFDVKLECRSAYSTEAAAKQYCLSLDGCNAMRWLPRERADANACFGTVNDIDNPVFDSSISTNSLWNTGLFTEQQDIPTGYSRMSPGCVYGNNMALREDYSIQECADWCDSTPGCLAFEYGVNHGGNQTLYASRDCQLQSHADPAPFSVCADYNLDLYVQPGFECPEGTVGPYNNHCYCLDFTDFRYKPSDSSFCDGSDSATTYIPIGTSTREPNEGCDAGQICPGDNMCRGACARGLDSEGNYLLSPCELHMRPLFDHEQCGCAEGRQLCPDMREPQECEAILCMFARSESACNAYGSHCSWHVGQYESSCKNGGYCVNEETYNCYASFLPSDWYPDFPNSYADCASESTEDPEETKIPADGCESGQICPGDNLCSGACANGPENKYACQHWMVPMFETNTCICSDRSAPCSSEDQRTTAEPNETTGDGVNGEQYCESDDMINNEVACKSSSCCHWNTWEEGEASFNGKGRCWSSIGQDICSDTTDVCQLCSRNDCLGNGACLLIEDNGEFTCEIDPLHFTSQSVCDSDYGHWCEKCDGKQLNEEDDESSFNTPLVIGIVGAVVFVAAIAVCIWDQKMRSQKPTPDGHQTGTMVV